MIRYDFIKTDRFNRRTYISYRAAAHHQSFVDSLDIAKAVEFLDKLVEIGLAQCITRGE